MSEPQSLDDVRREAIVPDALAGKRVDQVVQMLWPEFSRGRLQKWIKSGELTLDSVAVVPKAKVRAGQRVQLQATLKPEQDWSAQALPLAIVYEDEHIMVIDKPANVVVHPAPGHSDHTLVNALVYHSPGLSHLPRAGIVHRIDKDTTGLLVVAKTLQAHAQLVEAMQARRIKREYFALVWGEVTGSGSVDKPIGRHPHHRTKMAVVSGGKPAVTHYQIARRFAQHTLLAVQLETGRTHQIRVHLSHLGLPIVGDPVYGGRHRIPAGGDPKVLAVLEQFNRQALHAAQLTLDHPITAKAMHFEAPLPADFQNLLDVLT